MSKSNDTRSRKLSFLGFNTRSVGTSTPDEVLLDTEMEKVFTDPVLYKEKFEVLALADVNSSSKVEKPIFKIKSDASPKDEENSLGRRRTQSDQKFNYNEPTTAFDSKTPEEKPLVSKRAEFAGDHSDSSVEEKRVQFFSKTPESPKNDSTSKDHRSEISARFDGRKRRRSRHQYYRYRKYSHTEEDTKIRGDVLCEVSTPDEARGVSLEGEDSALEEADLNELKSHRSDDPRALRRHKVRPQLSKFSDLPKGNVTIPLRSKKTYDHSPHEVFVQLDELIGTGEEREWKETARWIKYEEHVEEGSDRWGRPHVASLSFHSLLNLRRCLETGVVLLDLDERDLPAVAYRVVEQMVVEDLIGSDDKPTVMRALLLRHRHVNEYSHTSFSFGKKKYNSYTSLQNLSEDRKTKIVSTSEVINGSSKKTDYRIDIKEDTYSSSQEDLKKVQNDNILRRIPRGAEATTVLVGAVDFLDQPTIAFVRLAEGIPMASITEVPIPVRFLFILLGPKIIDLDYHEVGRSIATLMSNDHFHNIAYKADDRKELLSAINEFLDDSIVLPPGNWDRHDLLPFEEIKAKRDWIRSRKKKALQEKQKASKLPTGDEKLITETVPAEKKPPGPLEKTHRFWGGLRNDIKRRYPLYKSDILDGLNSETLAATVFMYFAALSTAITFGGLSSEKTHNLIGISETLLSASIVGLVFHALSGQPLVIIGTTGPLLLFDESLYKFCTENELSFLTVRAYVGIWLVIISLAVSAFEGSVYVRLFTRFTQEIFSALITLIYIFETVIKLITVYGRHPLLSEYIYEIGNEVNLVNNITTAPILDSSHGNVTFDDNIEALINSTTGYLIRNESLSLNNETENINVLKETTTATTTGFLLPYDELGPINQPNTALFCTISTLGTFVVAYYLKLFRNSHFLGRNARRALGDFGVPIAIAIFVTIDYLIPQVYTEKLSVPEGISPSDPQKRGWWIPLGPVPTWLPFLAGIPAALVYILIFMETHISELIVDKPERGLKKGSGLHFDIVLLCFLNVICGFFGMPWHCAATVRSVAHVSAVTIMSRTHAPGESPRIIEVKEQRLSGVFVAIMVGLSVTMAPLLRLIPMAVLFGVFLYMGVASMSGVQFFERIRLYFMPVKHHPPTAYVKRVPTWKMHLFTAIQVSLLAVLWVVKSSKISLAFPFFLIMMVPLRMKLASLYTTLEMNSLDGNQPTVEADDEPDFYEQATIPA